jgi:hypothetical protein
MVVTFFWVIFLPFCQRRLWSYLMNKSIVDGTTNILDHNCTYKKWNESPKSLFVEAGIQFARVISFDKQCFNFKKFYQTTIEHLNVARFAGCEIFLNFFFFEILDISLLFLKFLKIHKNS